MEILYALLIFFAFVLIISSIIPDKFFIVKLKDGENIPVKNVKVSEGTMKYETLTGEIEFLAAGEWTNIKEIRNV